jgi:hypothetical protein
MNNRLRSGERVVLFAHPRSGSTNLYQVLQAHPALHILEEPFNEHYASWQPGNQDYLASVHDARSLDAQLAEIFTHYNGLKMLDYQLSDALLEHILSRPDLRIVFLRRRNLLQTIVSNLIAVQTNLWKKWEMERPLEVYYAGLQPLDISEVRSRVEQLARHLQWCESVLDRRTDGRVLKIVYEDFYFAPPTVQEASLDRLWRFLDLEPLPLAGLEYYLRPEMTKLNTPDTYRLLPNAAEINARCGSDRYGWLFDL